MKVFTYPDMVLSQKCRDVLPGEDVSELLDTMHKVMLESAGCGLAASQIGDMRRVIIIDPSPRSGGDTITEMVNPVIIDASVSKYPEGEQCLSFPGVRATVNRSVMITVTYDRRDGVSVKRSFSGFAARIIQHEIDHLNGVTLLDHMKPTAKRGAIALLLANQSE